jgi:hypothetical protein
MVGNKTGETHGDGTGSGVDGSYGMVETTQTTVVDGHEAGAGVETMIDDGSVTITLIGTVLGTDDHSTMIAVEITTY